MLLLLSACLIDTDLHARRLLELTDGDGDGFVMEDECDDTDAQVHPLAEETCDGIDQDCDGVVDNDAVDQLTWFQDSDSDGHGDQEVTMSSCDPPADFVAVGDDCDDGDATVSPGSTDTWYDGVDSDCDGADDYDADGDGYASEDWEGDDCDDSDPLTSVGALEGWYDAGIDNNCDGSVEDQALADLGDLGVRIDGTAASGSLGASVLALPAGWAADEAVLLAAAPFQGAGDVYGWPGSALSSDPQLANASWHLTGVEEASYFGFGMAWAGSADAPLVLISSEGANATAGRVDGWTGEALGDTSAFSVHGDTVGAYFGGQVVSGYDHDGDGVHDLLATAPLDARVAAGAGAAFLFLDPGGLTGDVALADADIEYTTTYAGALLAVSNVGDTDGDGLEDLGFDLTVSFEEAPGGLLVAGGLAPGAHDVLDASFAQLYAAGNAFGMATDWDHDGTGELLVASGGLDRYALPLAGTVTPWDDSEDSLAFTDKSDVATGIRTDVDAFAGHETFLLISSSYEGGQGGIFVHTAYWADSTAADESRFAALGGATGDGAGGAVDLADFDDDGVMDVVVGAAGADNGGTGAGSVYVVPGPR
jgi:Putative metal-binding motif